LTTAREKEKKKRMSRKGFGNDRQKSAQGEKPHLEFRGTGWRPCGEIVKGPPPSEVRKWGGFAAKGLKNRQKGGRIGPVKTAGKPQQGGGGSCSLES